MGEIATVCACCDKATTGKIYDPYWCVDCKIDSLTQEVKYQKDIGNEAVARQRETQKEVDELRRYKWAFEMLVKELSKQ